MRHLQLKIILFVLLAGPASAEWRVAPSAGEGGFISSEPTALAVGDSGYHVLGLTCRSGQATLFTMGYPAAPGESDDTIRVIVDGTSMDLKVRSIRPDGLWIGAATAQVIAALQRGSRASVSVPGQTTVAYTLRGSSRAISSATQGCTGSAVGQSAPVEASPDTIAPGVPSRLDTEIRAACRGGYSLAQNALLAARLDGDELPDTVLDWSGVKCERSDVGRGAGHCGMVMCRVSVVPASGGPTLDFLGEGIRLVPRAFGRMAIASRRHTNCSNGAPPCDVIFGVGPDGLRVIQ